MADYHQRNPSRYRGFGHASVRHKANWQDLTGTFVADLVLQILSYVAQTERENTKQRQMEGIAAAKLRGVQFGRPRKEVPEEIHRLKLEWEQKRIASRAAAKRLGISQDTFLRWVNGR